MVGNPTNFPNASKKTKKDSIEFPLSKNSKKTKSMVSYIIYMLPQEQDIV